MHKQDPTTPDGFSIRCMIEPHMTALDTARAILNLVMAEPLHRGEFTADDADVGKTLYAVEKMLSQVDEGLSQVMNILSTCSLRSKQEEVGVAPVTV